MTFFTLLYHSGDDGGVVVTPPPTVSGPGSVGGFEPEHDRRRRLAEKRKRLDSADKFFSERNRYVPPPDIPERAPGPIIINPPVMADISYEGVASRIEAAAREATAERMRLLRQKQMMIDDEEAIALLLLMN